MDIKGAREIIKKAGTPGAMFWCDDPRLFDINALVAGAKGFISGYEAGVREASVIAGIPQEDNFSGKILNLLKEVKK